MFEWNCICVRNCVLGCETESNKLKLLYLFSVNPDTHMGTHTHDLNLLTTHGCQAKCRRDASFCCNGNVPMETSWAINQQNQTPYHASKLQYIPHKYLNRIQHLPIHNMLYPQMWCRLRNKRRLTTRMNAQEESSMSPIKQMEQIMFNKAESRDSCTKREKMNQYCIQ